MSPFDPELAIAWPTDIEKSLSDKDASAPTLADARAQGLLPDYEVCRTFRRGLAG